MGLQTEKHRSLKYATAGCFKRHRKLRTRPAVTGQDVVQVGGGRASAAGDFIDGLPGGEEAIFQAHDPQCNSSTLPGQGVRLPCSALPIEQNEPMPWTQVTNFKRHLSEYQKRTGKTQVEVAKELGTSYGTLRFWLSGTRCPRLATLQRVSTVFGCPVTDLLDDPGRPVEGAQPDASEFDRFLLGVVGVDVASMDLAQKQAAFTAWKAIVAALKSI